MESGENAYKCVFIVKYDLSGYVIAKATAEADSDTTSKALIDCFKTFARVHTWISDQESHLKETFIAEVKQKLHVHHHFILQYCQWPNVSGRMVCRELLDSAGIILSKLKIPTNSWPAVTLLVEFELNNTPIKRLYGSFPQAVFKSIPQHSASQSILILPNAHGKPTKA